MSAQAVKDDVTVRQADGNDLEAVVHVGRVTWPATYGSIFEPECVELLLDKWWTNQACIPTIRAGRTLVAERGGRIVGVLTYGRKDGRLVIWKFYVLPEHQGRGVGQALLREVIDRVHDTADALYLPFADGNASAYDFATGQGFTDVGHEEQSGTPDLIWMRLDIAGHPGPSPGRR